MRNRVLVSSLIQGAELQMDELYPANWIFFFLDRENDEYHRREDRYILQIGFIMTRKIQRILVSTRIVDSKLLAFASKCCPGAGAWIR